MATINVNVSPEIIKWALSQTQEGKISQTLMNNITKWLDGTKTPTFNQIEEFSKKSNIPLGYFFLQKPPAEPIKLLEYRTLDSVQLANPSRNLIETIQDMENIQDWMKSYREELGFDKLDFVGSVKDHNDIQQIANKIRLDLELSKNWYENCSDSRESFNYIRKLLEDCGVIVMQNGIVKNNTRRALNIEEFRAFTIIDDWAPLIFINSADSRNAKLFSLLHELAHIWIGKDDLFNDRHSKTTGVSHTEIICNAIAGELLVPNDIFMKKWSEYAMTFDTNSLITELTKYFCCGETVIARKALDNHMISQQLYYQISQQAIDNYNFQKKYSSKSGGDFYRTMGARLDKCFVRALCESINIGRTSYTEAFRLTNTNHKTFSEIINRMGGMKW